jgi:thiosulfate reductase cytochrome b subunit
MCHDCFTSLVTFEKDPRDRIAKIMVVQDKKEKRKTAIVILSLLIPGSNLVYTGKVLKGALLMFLFLIPPTLIAVSLVHRIAIYPYMHSWFIFVLASITLGFYSVNIFTTRRLLKKWV